MKKPGALAGRCIALSISESPEMAVLGLGKEHLEDAMTELARHLIASGASVAYGGDLRPGIDRGGSRGEIRASEPSTDHGGVGFTNLLFEVVNRYRLNRDEDRILVRNYLAWPVHSVLRKNDIEALQHGLEGLADLILLSLDGKRISLDDRPQEPITVKQDEWIDGLTAMRRTMAAETQARIVLGGKTSGFKGSMPGIAEEALIQLNQAAPLYVLGGFGGCSHDLAVAMRLDTRSPTADWTAVSKFNRFSPSNLRNGLTEAENKRLASTAHVDEAAALVMRGLFKLSRKNKRRN
jgi:hypothetical protein